MNSRLPEPSDRLLWERAAIESRISANVLRAAADLAHEESLCRVESILRQLAEAASQPRFEKASAQLVTFAALARRTHHLQLAAAADAVLASAKRLSAAGPHPARAASATSRRRPLHHT